MARRIHYKIDNDGKNYVSDKEWEEILKLQRWYNSEFFWSAGRIALKMFSVFPNLEKTGNDKKKFWEKIETSRNELIKTGLSEIQIIRKLESEGLIIVKQGGYKDDCIASGYTRVANNEFNAYLVCEFLLKVSLIIEKAVIEVYDEGKFIKCKRIILDKGNLIALHKGDKDYKEMINYKKIFSIVNPEKYNDFPKFKNLIKNYKDLDKKEKLEVLRDWRWLGFDDNYDLNGDDIQGFNLNAKVKSFSEKLINK